MSQLVFGAILLGSVMTLGAPHTAAAAEPGDAGGRRPTQIELATAGTYKECGSFRASYRILVSARGMPCKTAVKILREYWLGPASRHRIVNGGHGAGGYILLKRYPGWKCYSGQGAGHCVKGSKDATYETALL